jgi:hypothetical protein
MHLLCRTLALAVLFVLPLASVRSGEKDELRPIIDKAIKAQGGEEKLAKQKAFQMKGGGHFYGAGEGIPYTAEWFIQGEKQFRFDLALKVMDQTITVTKIVNGDKGWVKFANMVKDMSKDELTEEKAEMYVGYVTTLLPLKDKAFKLSPLGEVKVDDKTAVGIRVTREGKREVNLYFDKTTGLLVKVENTVRDSMAGFKEANQEVFYADYKEFDGVKHATKIKLLRDGKRYVEAEITEIRPQERLDDSLFAKP